MSVVSGITLGSATNMDIATARTSGSANARRRVCNRVLPTMKAFRRSTSNARRKGAAQRLHDRPRRRTMNGAAYVRQRAGVGEERQPDARHHHPGPIRLATAMTIR